MTLPARLPACCARLLERPGWFEPALIRSTRLRLASPWVRIIQRLAGVPVAATAIGHVIYFRRSDFFDPHSPDGLSLLAHELRHVQQYQECGVVSFAFLYTWEYLHAGYGVHISFEAEADQVGRLVHQHLLWEFSQNIGQPMCLAPAEHQPNPGYKLLDPGQALPRRR